MRKSTPASLSWMGKGVSTGTFWMTVTSSTSSSKPRGSAGVGADFAGDGEAGFEGEVLQGLEDFFGDGGFGDDALDGAGAVAEDGEEKLARGAEVVEPAAEGDGLAFVGGEGGYGGEGCRGCYRHETKVSLRVFVIGGLRLRLEVAL